MPVKVIGSVETKEEFGVAIRKEDTALLEFMNEAIAELQQIPTGRTQREVQPELTPGDNLSPPFFVTLNHIRRFFPIVPTQTRRHRP